MRSTVTADAARFLVITMMRYGVMVISFHEELNSILYTILSEMVYLGSYEVSEI